MGKVLLFSVTPLFNVAPLDGNFGLCEIRCCGHSQVLLHFNVLL